MRDLVGDPGFRGRLASAALADVAERSWGSVVGQLVDEHYRQVLHSGSAPAAA